MGDFVYDNLGWILVGIIVGLLTITVLAFRQEAKAREAFMAQCLEDRKQYECFAMWRSGQNHTVVVPMPIITGR